MFVVAELHHDRVAAPCHAQALRPGEGRLYTIDASPAGLMLLLRLPAGASDEDAMRRLERGGIEALSLSSHYAGRSRQQGLLLSFAGFSEAALAKAAKGLIAALGTP